MPNRKYRSRDEGTSPGARPRTYRTENNTVLWIVLGSAAVVILAVFLLSSEKKQQKRPVQSKHEKQNMKPEKPRAPEIPEKQPALPDAKTVLPAEHTIEAEGTSAPDTESASPTVWETVQGRWSSSQGEITYSGGRGRGIFLYKKDTRKYCEIAVSIKSGSGSAGVLFSYSPGSYIIARWNGNGTCEVVTVSGSAESCIQKAVCSEPDSATFTQFKVDTRGKRVMVEINGSLIMQTPIIDSLSEGYTGLMAECESPAVFRGFSVKDTSTEKCTMCEP